VDGTLDSARVELERNAELMESLQRDHQRYRDERWAHLSPEDQAYVHRAHYESNFFERGIGGIANTRCGDETPTGL
jgi:hypothetical protein